MWFSLILLEIFLILLGICGNHLWPHNALLPQFTVTAPHFWFLMTSWVNREPSPDFHDLLQEENTNSFPSHSWNSLLLERSEWRPHKSVSRHTQIQAYLSLHVWEWVPRCFDLSVFLTQLVSKKCAQKSPDLWVPISGTVKQEWACCSLTLWRGQRWKLVKKGLSSLHKRPIFLVWKTTSQT